MVSEGRRCTEKAPWYIKRRTATHTLDHWVILHDTYSPLTRINQPTSLHRPGQACNTSNLPCRIHPPVHKLYRVQIHKSKLSRVWARNAILQRRRSVRGIGSGRGSGYRGHETRQYPCSSHHSTHTTSSVHAGWCNYSMC